VISQLIDFGYGHVGFLIATASEDRNLVLEVCDRASASEANAKEAVKALRQVFRCVAFAPVLSQITNAYGRHAKPSAQLSAARVSFSVASFDRCAHHFCGIAALGDNAPKFIGNIYAANNVSQVLKYPRGCINVAKNVARGKRTVDGRAGDCCIR
jgi:hypothetical protein